MKFKDQMNTVFELKETPKRIVCLVPSLTELLVDLGLESSLVGVTKFCVHPKNIRKSKKIVGGTKQIKIDKIKALKPDIVVCNKEENTPEIVAACRQFTTVHVSDIYTIEDTLALIQQYGVIFSCTDKAQEIEQEITEKYKDFKQFMLHKKAISSVYFIWKKPWMIAAKNTFIDSILQLNKFDNYFKDRERYPEIKLEEIKENVNVILLSSEPYPFKNKDIKSLRETFKNTKICLVNGEFFSWYGTRLIKAFDYFKAIRNKLD